MDFFNRTIEQAKQLQQTAAEATAKTVEQAQPFVREAVAKAQDLQKTFVEQAPHVTAAAQVQYNAAIEHAGRFIATGKSVLEAGTVVALTTFAEQARKAADAAVNAANATKTTPPPPPEDAA
jgi:ABC-type transporter Mla subunit MlaD